MKLVFVSSPLRGDVEKNLANARLYAKFVCESGHSPIAPHLLFTQFLDDGVEAERAAGIECGMKYLEKSDEMWVFAEDETKCSAGMKAELDRAKKLGKPVVFVNPARAV